jgi:hypothetical protein
MRRFASPLILLASACGSGNTGHQPPQQNVARPMPAAPPPAVPAAAANAIQAAPDEAPSDDPGLADLSPAQRRAYDLGYRDCSHGHYAPDNHLEAYRIGCGAAHDRMESGRPQG